MALAGRQVELGAELLADPRPEVRRALLEAQLLWAHRSGAVRVVARVTDGDGPVVRNLRAAGFEGDADTLVLELET